jgi:hypothetical protein
MVDFPEYYEQMRPSLAPPATPAPVAPAQPITPRPPLTEAELRALYLDPNRSDPPIVGPPRPPAPRPAARTEETPETTNALEQFQAAYRERLAGGQPQGQLSVLDMLRKRMARDMEGEALQRVGEFGAGMLASGSPNFFTMLGAGSRAAREGDASRMEQLRRLADAERQQQELETRQAAQRAEEEYRRQSLTLREREIAQGNRPQYNVVGQDAAGNAVVMDPRTGRRQTLEGVTPVQAANLNTRSDVANRQLATRLAEAAVNRDVAARAAAFQPALSETERATLRRQREAEILESLGLAPLPGTGPASSTTGGGGAGGPAARIDALGNPIR